MKILLGVLYYEPAWAYGGPPRMVFDLARELVRRGHEVTVCTTDALDRGQRVQVLDETSHGVRIKRFRNLSNWLAFHVKIFLPFGMRSWLEEHVRDFDVVHLFDARTLLNAWAARASMAQGVPFVLSVWGSLPSGRGWKAILKRRYDRKHGPVQLGRAAALLAQNDHEAQLYREYGGPAERVQIWPLAVDPESVEALPARGSFRAKAGLPEDALVVLFVGRINDLKGLSPLVRAFALARRHVPDARLVIVGRDDGALDTTRALTRELGVDDSVYFAGPLYGAHALPAYVDCDLFAITPTHYEETSLASLTACAVGRPVLINDRCRIPWLDEYNAGRCVAHSVEALGDALIELLGDRVRLREMGQRARQMAQERFFLPRIVDQIEAIYRRSNGAVSQRSATR